MEAQEALRLQDGRVVPTLRSVRRRHHLSCQLQEGFGGDDVMTKRERIGRIEVDVEGVFYDLKGRKMIYKLQLATQVAIRDSYDE